MQSRDVGTAAPTKPIRLSGGSALRVAAAESGAVKKQGAAVEQPIHAPS